MLGECGCRDDMGRRLGKWEKGFVVGLYSKRLF